MGSAAKSIGQNYHKLWIWLLLGWIVSAADRAITGPVITWMIENQVAFLGASDHPHSLGGLVGSLFFAGYMLTQFPGGYLGDKFGHRTIIVISIIWAVGDRFGRVDCPPGDHRIGGGCLLLQRPHPDRGNDTL